MKSLIELTERGWIPDALVRIGIRRLLGRRLAAQEEGGPEEQRRRRDAFLEEMRRSPIALNTTDANEQHYELPAAFFEQVLGPNLKYSSGYWSDGAATLADAEEAMLRKTCGRAGLVDGMEVLELGCGWGSLSLWIAREYPACRVLAVSNSASQAEFIRRRCAEIGLDNLEVRTADMNTFDPGRTFDRVLSIEMFEHMRNWPELFSRISRWLNPGGQMLMHVFCHRTFVYPYLSSGPSDWMAEFFFTGGIMPSDDLPYAFSDDLSVERSWKINGLHYSQTLEAWLEKMDRCHEELMPLFREVYGKDAARWFRRWRLFFMACSELFAYRGGDEWWVSHYLLVPAEQKAAEHPQTMAAGG